MASGKVDSLNWANAIQAVPNETCMFDYTYAILFFDGVLSIEKDQATIIPIQFFRSIGINRINVYRMNSSDYKYVGWDATTGILWNGLTNIYVI